MKVLVQVVFKSWSITRLKYCKRLNIPKYIGSHHFLIFSQFIASSGFPYYQDMHIVHGMSDSLREIPYLFSNDAHHMQYIYAYKCRCTDQSSITRLDSDRK